MKRPMRIALALTTSLFLAVGSLGCSQSSAPTGGDEAVVEKEDDVRLEDVQLEGEDAEEALVEDGATQDGAQEAATQRIGAEGTGFVTIPESWVEFHDVDGNSSIQWCDGTPYTVISLNTFDLSTVPEEERASFTLEDAANSVWGNILNDGAAEDAVQGARVTLAGRDALQVYALFPDGSYLVCWLLEDDAGVIRYVAAEGTEDTIFDAVGYVEATYEL